MLCFKAKKFLAATPFSMWYSPHILPKQESPVHLWQLDFKPEGYRIEDGAGGRCDNMRRLNLPSPNSILSVNKGMQIGTILKASGLRSRRNAC
jgi:hypothetical protein